MKLGKWQAHNLYSTDYKAYKRNFISFFNYDGSVNVSLSIPLISKTPVFI